MTPEKERMKELCQPVCEWVKTMKKPVIEGAGGLSRIVYVLITHMF
jgi:hypothetical protein